MWQHEGGLFLVLSNQNENMGNKLTICTITKETVSACSVKITVGVCPKNLKYIFQKKEWKSNEM